MTPLSALQAPVDHEVLLGEIQHVLAALADVETDFAVACEEASEAAAVAQPGAAPRGRPDLQRLEAERQRRREPLIRRLDSLDRACRALFPANAC
ncbi:MULTISPECIES: hypothetical protein [Methylobacterium]|uniref:hypothetical protein n=1 Tax=Methylobacterium TaxID=407 RepID=UPI00104410C3|nr:MULTISPECIES: hypothetical protein [Methylobacterium]MDR7039242.1 hypothetical protein [Methylobacterium sp. BE186]